MSQFREWSLWSQESIRELVLVFAEDRRSLIHEVLWIEADSSIHFKVEGLIARLTAPVRDGRVSVRFSGDVPAILAASGSAQFLLLNADQDHKRRPEAMISSWITNHLLQNGVLGTSKDDSEFQALLEPCPRSGNVLEMRAGVERSFARARSFFHKLEQLTNFESMVPKQVELYQYLGRRLEIRAAYGKPPSEGGRRECAGWQARLPKVRPYYLSIAQDVSHLTRTLIRAEAPQDVGWIFELFAMELLGTRNPDDRFGQLNTQGVPNGRDFFKFTEFCLLCIENDVHADFWSSCLADFVRASHIYAEHAFVDRDHLRFEPNRIRYPMSRVRTLRQLYPSTLSRTVLTDLFTDIIGKTLEARFEARRGTPLTRTARLEYQNQRGLAFVSTLVKGVLN